MGVITLKARHERSDDDSVWWITPIPYASPMAGANGNYTGTIQGGELHVDDDWPAPINESAKPVCR